MARVALGNDKDPWLVPTTRVAPAPGLLPKRSAPQASEPSLDNLPVWNDLIELKDHAKAIMEFRTRPCLDFQRGFCAKHGMKPKVAQCFFWHFMSQKRRPPINAITGQLTYWDVPCPSFNNDVGSFCPAGELCPFTHGRDELSYHPAKYKTRACNGHDCRGEGVCCFAHGDGELRTFAPERYSFQSFVSPKAGSPLFADTSRRSATTPAPISSPFVMSSGQAGPKSRFCATYPNVHQCRRGALCGWAHTREEVQAPLMLKEEEDHEPHSLTEEFFTRRFKTLWCPIGAQHDWQSCVYAHTYQDARRDPGIGYGPQPCPYWSKKDTRIAYSQRCPLGLRCPYSHGAKEQLYHPRYFRTVVCRDLQQKGCPRQILCAFHHRRAERRFPLADNMDYSKPLKKEAIEPTWAASFLCPPIFQEEIGEAPRSSTSTSTATASTFWQAGQSTTTTGTRSTVPALKEMRPVAPGLYVSESPRTQSTAHDSDPLAEDKEPTSGRDHPGTSPALSEQDWQGADLGFSDWYPGTDMASWAASGAGLFDPYLGGAAVGFTPFYEGHADGTEPPSAWWPEEEATTGAP